MKRIFNLCFFIDSIFSVKASHMSGADLSYVYLGSGNYKIIVTTYRDCNGIQITAGSATIKSGTTSFSLSLKSQSTEDITKITKSCMKSKCDGANFPFGLQKDVFYGIVNLGSYKNLCEFNVSWEQCCRNGSITTGASGANFYVDMIINRCYDSTNSSPQFTMGPLSAVTEDKPVSYNPVLVDTMDGYDSLSYEMALPLSATGTVVNYTTPYSLDAPLTYLGFPQKGLTLPSGYSLDTYGNLRFKPKKAGEQTVLVMKVKEWKNINGVMRVVSELNRDMQVYVIKSQNNEPQTTVFNDFTYCIGNNPYTFEIPFTDADSGTFLHTRVISSIPRLKYNIVRDSTSKDSKTTIKFEISTDTTMINKYPHQFTVVVNDSACSGLYGEFVYRYNLFIKAGIDTTQPPLINFSKFCNSYEFKGIDSLGFGYKVWEWYADSKLFSSSQNAIYTIDKIGTKKIT